MAITQKIKKRNGTIADFTPPKVTIAVQKAFAAVTGDAHEKDATEITAVVVQSIDAQFGNTAFFPTVETIQDLVETALMERGYFAVAKSYIIYRYEHEKIREEKKQEIAEKIADFALYITKRDGSREAFSESKVTRTLLRAAAGLERDIDVPAIVSKVRQEMYDGIKTRDIHEVLIMVTRSFIERDPSYSVIAARLLLQEMYRDVLGAELQYAKLEDQYREAFVHAIKRGVEIGQFDPEMLTFDLHRLCEALVIERDMDFKYLGLQTLQANYLSKVHGTKELLETPQIFWMRVAMGTALTEKTPEDRNRYAIEFYEIMSAMYYTPSSPTLYHAGLVKPQLSSCFLNTVPDDLQAIFKSYSDNAQLLKYAGGTGTDWTPVRATGALVKTTGVESQGVIPFLKIANDVTISINRSGRRRGAAAVYLEYWHFDIEEFIELRKNTGDERRRTHDISTATWIPDLFMKRLAADDYWTLLSPHEAPDLHDLYGRAFEERYVYYEKMAETGKLQLHKKVRAAELWRKTLTMLFETGHPWITWKDPSNIRSPQDHVGVVHNSNLCTEITLNTSANETAVCNLGSINMARFIENGVWSRERVAKVVPVAMRMLDNVIDINYYPTEDARRSNMRHRPVGLGLRGLQDALYLLDINFASEEAVRFSDESMEHIAYHAILSSALLAQERGAYETYKGSKWDRGIFPQDTIALLEQERGTKIDVPRHETLDWRLVREAVRKFGMRNSNTMANAPTASTANIAGCYPTIEPIYKNLYVKSNMAGDFIVVNDYLVEDLKRLGLWNEDMLERIKYHDGSIQEITEISPQLREKYKETFEIEPQWLIKAAAFRGRWIDQSQSLNIFYGGTSGRVLSEIYQYAWSLGLKTTYYLRTMGASRVEKSTVNLAKFGGTSHSESGAAVASGTLIVEETVSISMPSPVIVEASQIIEGLEELRQESLTTVQAIQSEPLQARAVKQEYTAVSAGIPTFSAPTIVENKPVSTAVGKVEIIGEVCESCSA